MKWGKALNAKVQKQPEWSPNFLNYKKMKKSAKAAKEMSDGTVVQTPDDVKLDQRGLVLRSEDSLDRLKSAVGTKAAWPFLTDLNQEVANVENFFKLMVKTYATRIDEVEGKRLAKEEPESGTIAFREIERGLKTLEEFSRANYISTVKILKKVDKLLSVNVKDIYLTEVLNVQSFLSDQTILRTMRQKIEELMKAPSSITDADNEESAEVSRRQRTTDDTDLHSLRDLNNDFTGADSLNVVSMCVPLRRVGGELEVMVIVSYDGPLGLVKASIEAGESSEQAGIREMSERAGVRVNIHSRLGEYLSTTKRNTMYLAYYMTVEEEYESWPLEASISRKWMGIEEAIAELEDNTAIRVLLSVKENSNSLQI